MDSSRDGNGLQNLSPLDCFGRPSRRCLLVFNLLVRRSGNKTSSNNNCIVSIAKLRDCLPRDNKSDGSNRWRRRLVNFSPCAHTALLSLPLLPLPASLLAFACGLLHCSSTCGEDPRLVFPLIHIRRPVGRKRSNSHF